MKLTKLSIVAALLLSSSAFAAQEGFFAGADVGYGITHAPKATAPVSLKNKGVVYGFNVGYNFDNYFGVEGQANKDASFKYSDAGVTVIKYNMYDADLLADGYFPIADSFDLVGKAGVAYVRGDLGNNMKHAYRPKAAVGVSYIAADNVSVSATYSRVFKTGNFTFGQTKYVPNIDVAAITVDYLF